ncbi:DUF305 domain-containing protein [Iamia sp. SCSIO 61187]|uniref:DUF305 domain-containing protein n=1 Tax=Iamia sp. SCSIO 61187 TaxID=2722752 RepID=UPI001C62F7F6|nr:DUF305 domain-containing protein [Iamia sp. SCSIO 61187]QYG94241.1 DUF305 domain-containing protein [Iamia sp. SCSIO 61187]
MKKRIVLGFVALIGLASLLAACGGDDDMAGMDHGGDDSSETTEAAAADAEFNGADVSFAQSMIPHHEQAVEMADLADGRAESPEVIDLAERIKAAQDPEIELMRGWLEDWGQEMPEAMDHEGMAGMMGDEDMTALEDASGAEFDEMFLTMMIEHHEGAIEQAETELDDGQNAAAKELAQTIIDAQRGEIEEMQGILDAA